MALLGLFLSDHRGIERLFVVVNGDFIGNGVPSATGKGGVRTVFHFSRRILFKSAAKRHGRRDFFTTCHDTSPNKLIDLSCYFCFHEYNNHEKILHRFILSHFGSTKVR